MTIPDPWAAAVEAGWLATCGAPNGEMECPKWPKCDTPCRACFDLNLTAVFRAALPHLIEAVVTEAFPDGQYEHTSAGPIADLRRAATRLTGG